VSGNDIHGVAGASSTTRGVRATSAVVAPASAGVVAGSTALAERPSVAALSAGARRRGTASEGTAGQLSASATSVIGCSIVREVGRFDTIGVSARATCGSANTSSATAASNHYTVCHGIRRPTQVRGPASSSAVRPASSSPTSVVATSGSGCCATNVKVINLARGDWNRGRYTASCTSSGRTVWSATGTNQGNQH
jgi:hypothetical protein